MTSHTRLAATRRAVLGTAAAGLALLLPHRPARAAGQQLVVAQSSDVLTLDPTTDSSALGINVFGNIFDQLSDILPDGGVGPGIAESWDTNDDQTVWTFRLRTGVTFHDGTPLTIDDVIWTFNKILGDPKSPVRAYLTRIQKMERLDDHQLRFTVDAPFVTFARQVSLVSIVSQKAYEKMGPQQFSLTPVGSGPFKVRRWVKDSAVELDANPQYWGGAPKVQSLVFKPVPSEASRAAALMSGELDVVPVLPPTLVGMLANKPGVTIAKVVSNRAVFAGFNVADPVVSNVKVRQAINHAVDRDAITQKLLRGMGLPLGQLATPPDFGYDPTLKPPTYDPKLAKQLLTEAGYTGQKIVFDYPTNRWAFASETAQALAGFLQAVGVNVELRPMEFSALFPLWVQNKLSAMYMFSMGITILDADLLLNLEYESGTTHGYWSNPEVDALARQQRAQKDPEKRKQIMARIWRIAQDEAPFVPLYCEIQAYGVREGVEWKPRPDERLKFKDAVLHRS
jgi:peptide/nickel transport system substrate-binding protein